MTKRMSIVRILLLGAAAGALCASLGACTVKEDRELCPCYLHVDFVDREGIPESVPVMGWNGGELFRDGVVVAENDPWWIKPVHKQELCVTSYIGVDRASSDGHFLTIPAGSQCDSLYAFHEMVDATGEVAYAVVDYRKQFCTVFLSLGRSAAEMQDYRFLVKGNTYGFDLLDFSPVDGPFNCAPAPKAGENIVSFRIPRQKDDSLTVQLWLIKDGVMDDLGVYPLGKYIDRLGYDWGAEILQDVYVTLDMVLGLVVIGVDGWEDGVVFSYVEQ